MDAAVDHGAVWMRALELRDALLAGDGAAIEALSGAEFWRRAGRDELLGLIPHVTTATALGVLGRRSLLLVTAPGARLAKAALEQLWVHVDDRLLMEDERLFVLADRAEVEGSGDSERIERTRTKLDSQDAALAYAAALVAHDRDAAAAMWSPGYAAAHGDELRPQIPTVRRAELIGSVGPRTLLWLVMDDGERTVELLWRPHDGRLLIEGARSFTPVVAP